MSVFQYGSWIPVKVCLEPSCAQPEISLQFWPRSMGFPSVEVVTRYSSLCDRSAGRMLASWAEISQRLYSKVLSCDICTRCAVLPLCWQEEDDYESPNDDDPEGEDDGDYESPNEEEEVLEDSTADYEPPPSNDEEALQNSILPAKPFPNTNSMYIGKNLCNLLARSCPLGFSGC